MTVLISLIAGCGGAPTTVKDSAPAYVPINLAQVPDAIPRKEPRSRYGNPKTYQVLGKTYTTMSSSANYVERGGASWYGTKFHGRRTSSGETYNMYAMTAAHKTLPIPTYVRVTNLDNGKQVTVRVNDRGPFHKGRIIDLSYAAAARLDMLKQGTSRVEVRAIDAHSPRVATVTPNREIPPETVAKQPSAEIPMRPAPPSAEPGPPKQLFVQVGAFKQANNASQARQRLLDAGLTAVQVHTENHGSFRLHKVQLGPVQDVQAADALRENLEKLGWSQVGYVSR